LILAAHVNPRRHFLQSARSPGEAPSGRSVTLMTRLCRRPSTHRLGVEIHLRQHCDFLATSASISAKFTLKSAKPRSRRPYFLDHCKTLSAAKVLLTSQHAGRGPLA
jgi:hypothetical protein